MQAVFSPVKQAVVRAQFVRRLRFAVCRQIGRGGGEVVVLAREGARFQGGIGAAADAEGEIEAVGAEIGALVALQQFYIQLRVAAQQPAQPRRDVPLPEGQRGMDADAAGRGFVQVGQCLLCRPPLLHQCLGMSGKTVPRCGGQHGAGGAVKERRVQGGFQLADTAGDDRHGEVVLPRRGGKAVAAVNVEEEAQGA